MRIIGGLWWLLVFLAAKGTWREIKISPGALMDYVEREVRESLSPG